MYVSMATHRQRSTVVIEDIQATRGDAARSDLFPPHLSRITGKLCSEIKLYISQIFALSCIVFSLNTYRYGLSGVSLRKAQAMVAYRMVLL